MGPWMYDSWMHGWFGMWPLPILVFVLLIVLILFLGKGFSARNSGSHDVDTREPAETALDILKKRYAKGEVNKEEFERIKQDILG